MTSRSPVGPRDWRLSVWRSFLRAHAHVVAALERDLTESADLPLAWYDVLLQLVEAPEWRLRMADLAAAIGLSASRMTRMIDDLQERNFVAKRPSLIATVPVGYADGYPRALSGRAEVVIRGGRAPLAGRVCMDQIMIDVTDVAGAAIGDEVELWGRELPVEEIAAIAHTIPYELVTRVGARVPRVATSPT